MPSELRGLETPAYLLALVLLVAVPLFGTTARSIEAQATDAAVTNAAASNLTLERAIAAVMIPVRKLRERTNEEAALTPSERAAVTKPLLRLDTLGYSAASAPRVQAAVERIDRAWTTVEASDGAGAQVITLLDQLHALRADVSREIRVGGWSGDALTALLDATIFAIPLTQDRIDVAASLVGEDATVERLAGQAQAAFRDVASDVARAESLGRPSPAQEHALAKSRAAVDSFASAASGGAPRASRSRLTEAALTSLDGLADLTAAGAERLQQERRAAQASTSGWLWLKATFVLACTVLIGLGFWNSVQRRSRRALARANEEIDRLQVELERDRKRALAESSEGRFAAVFDNAALGLAVLDSNGRVVRRNAALQALLPSASPHDLGARNPHFQAMMTGESPGFTYELDCSRPDGERWLEVSVSPLHNDAGEPVFAVSLMHDITERRAAEQRLRYEARYDALLGMPNRAALVERLAETIALPAPSRAPGLLLIDLQGFKVINDSLGHEVGDRVLIASADRLREVIGPQDVIARFGGTEFAVLLKGRSTTEELIALGHRIVAHLGGLFDIVGRDVYVTVCAGLVLVDRTYRSADAVLRDADTALYSVRAEGRSVCGVFDAAMRDAALRRLEIAVQLRRTIEREQIFLVYQPVVELASGAPTSFEVLLRWDHPTLGSVGPAEFIPIAEETGVIFRLGRFVLEHACEQLASWRAQSTHFETTSLSVNVSLRELQQPDYCELVRTAVERNGLGKGDLVLELAESTVVQRERCAAGTFERLREIGVGLAVDNVGRGRSSLHALEDFAFDQVKIDGSFVRGKGSGLATEPVVKMLVELGHTFGVKVIAEGVETIEQVTALRRLGCDAAQGYYYGKPALPSEIPALFELPPRPAE